MTALVSTQNIHVYGDSLTSEVGTTYVTHLKHSNVTNFAVDASHSGDGDMSYVTQSPPPDIAILMFGTIDSHETSPARNGFVYSASINSLLDKFTTDGINDVILMFPPHRFPDEIENGTIDVYHTFLKQLSENHAGIIKGHTVDYRQVLNVVSWFVDGVHPSVAGHAQVAQQIQKHINDIAKPDPTWTPQAGSSTTWTPGV